MIACAMQPLRLYALYTDDCLRSQQFIADSRGEFKPGAVALAVAEQATVAAEKLATVAAFATPGAVAEGTYEVIYADDIELLSDGRVGAVVRQISIGGESALLPQNPTYRFFAIVDGQWLYDCDAPVSRG
jgi:hypothetical protein